MTDKEKFENINQLIRSLIWPIVLVFVFIIYSTELNQIIQLIPKKLEATSKISVYPSDEPIPYSASLNFSQWLGRS